MTTGKSEGKSPADIAVDAVEAHFLQCSQMTPSCLEPILREAFANAQFITTEGVPEHIVEGWLNDRDAWTAAAQ